MSELLLHFAIPLAVFSYFRRLREAFAASLIALLPDMDALLRVHRYVTHSLIVVLLACGIALLIIRAFRPGPLGFGITATLALLSHLVLDLFTAHTPLFWPLSGSSVLLSIYGNAHIAEKIDLGLDAEVSTEETDFTPFESLDGPIFTSEGLAASSILIASALLKAYSSSKTLNKGAGKHEAA